ncbi:MAG: DUF4405 domain-containing protein [Mailhella sp.]|nr:DUF4405 domain-containing protein [Mailhella sp.]
MCGLVLAHLWHNRGWLKNMTNGRYSLARIFRTVCFFALLAVTLAQLVSGVLISGRVFPFPAMDGISADARAAHLCTAYWCFSLMAVHAGIHLSSLAALVQKKIPAIFFCMVTLLLVIIGAYGAYAFVLRSFPDYMFLQKAFACFNFDEPLIFFLADYAAIFCSSSTKMN